MAQPAVIIEMCVMDFGLCFRTFTSLVLVKMLLKLLIFYCNNIIIVKS